MPCCMSTTNESHPAWAMTSAEKLLGMPHQLFSTGFPAAHNSRTLFARAIRSSWCSAKIGRSRQLTRQLSSLAPPTLPSPACGERLGWGLVEHFLVDDVVADRLAVEHGEDVLHGGNPHPVDRLAGNPGDMRRGDKVWQGQKRVVLRGRLLVEDVKCG